MGREKPAAAPPHSPPAIGPAVADAREERPRLCQAPVHIQLQAEDKAGGMQEGQPAGGCGAGRCCVRRRDCGRWADAAACHPAWAMLLNAHLPALQHDPTSINERQSGHTPTRPATGLAKKPSSWYAPSFFQILSGLYLSASSQQR